MSKEIIYQLIPRLFGNRKFDLTHNGTIAENGCGKFSDINNVVLKRIKELGTTMIWYTGIIRHATTTDYSRYGMPPQNPSIVKGKAGSPYAIVDYYDVDPDLATDVNHRFDEFIQLIERTHRTGMKVIIDFVPNHVARQYHSINKPEWISDLGENDNVVNPESSENNFFYLPNSTFSPQFEISDYSETPARATGNDCFTPSPSNFDWYDTIKLNYNNRDTWEKMLNIMMFWAATGVDGIRCDMAEMVSLDFWTWAIHQLKEHYPHFIIIGEVYQPTLYREFIRAGFDFLYDKVGMYDCLKDVIKHKRPAYEITQQWQSTDDINDHLLYFLENHDEVRIASEQFASDAKLALPALAIISLLRKNPIMIYAGQECGESGNDSEGFSGHDGKTTIFDYWALPSVYHQYYNRRLLTKQEKFIYDQYRKIVSFASTSETIGKGAFFDLTYANPHINSGIFSFIRKYKDNVVKVFACFNDNLLNSDNVEVIIPSHAFDYLNLKEGTHIAKELMSGEEQEILLKPDEKIAFKSNDIHCCVLSWSEK